VNLSNESWGDLNCDEVFQRLAHLEAFDMKMSDMNEVVDPLLAIVIRLLK
jgi:hypothetical protein